MKEREIRLWCGVVVHAFMVLEKDVDHGSNKKSKSNARSSLVSEATKNKYDNNATLKS